MAYAPKETVSRWGPVLTEDSVEEILGLDSIVVADWWNQHWPSLTLALERGRLQSCVQLVTILVDEFCYSFNVPMAWAMPEEELRQMAYTLGRRQEPYVVEDPEVCCGRMYRHAALEARGFDEPSRELGRILNVGLFRLQAFGDDLEKDACFQDVEEIRMMFTLEQWNGVFLAFALQTLYGVFCLSEMRTCADIVKEWYLRWAQRLAVAVVGPTFREQGKPDESSEMVDHRGHGDCVY